MPHKNPAVRYLRIVHTWKHGEKGLGIELQTAPPNKSVVSEVFGTRVPADILNMEMARVNGLAVKKLTHAQRVQLIQSAMRPLTIEFEQQNRYQ